MFGSRFFTGLLTVLAALLVLCLAVPIIGMVAKESPTTLRDTFADEEVRGAIWTSMSAAAGATAISLVLGVPLGYLLARRRFWGKALVQGIIDMPIVVPHTAAGIALLTVLSPSGIVGGPAGKVGIEFVDAMPGIIAAMLFLAAPFTVNAARSAFESVNPRLENVSRSLGATAGQTFFRVSLPLAIGQIVSGAIMCWARAVSEFGAVLVIAYYPRVGPVLMYDRFTSHGLASARPVAVVLVLISLAIFVALRVRIGGGNGRNATGMHR